MADSAWLELLEVAEELDAKYIEIVFDELGCEYDVDAKRRRFGTGWKIIEGLILMAWGCGPEGYSVSFEPVRERRWFSKAWQRLQPIEEAASTIEVRLNEWIADRRQWAGEADAD